MSNAVVIVQESVQLSPMPSGLQQTGAFVTMGGTNTTPGTLTLMTSASSAALSPILATALAITSITWTGSVATITTTAPHGLTTSTTQTIVVADAIPVGYNGTFQGSVTGASTITYPLASNPGSETTPGTVTLGAVSELTAMLTTYFANQGAPAVYIFECGQGSIANSVTQMTTYIGDNPYTGNNANAVYKWIVPEEWDDQTPFTSVLVDYDGNSAFTYFDVTTTVANRAVYAGHKCVLSLVEAPLAPSTEFSIAAETAITLGQSPSSSNKVPPLGYTFGNGVTPWPPTGNQTTFTELKTANVNIWKTAAEGGLTNSALFYGYMADGNQWNFWYAGDWLQINLKLNLANEVFIGSNSKTNPLQYNQAGIDRLQNRAVKTFNTSISNGLTNGSPVVKTKLPIADFLANLNDGDYVGQQVINAEPFSVYTAENPSAYGTGFYGGLTGIAIPLLGFTQILFNLTVTDILS